MRNAASFRRRLAARLVAAVSPLVAVAASGCCDTATSTRSLAWPLGMDCPPPQEAGFYLTGFADPGDCGTTLVSVDGPAARTREGCDYPVTTEYCECDHGF